MAEEADSDGVGGAAANPAALHAALDAADATAEARAFLRQQRTLTDLQIENLKKQEEYETSHLRWRRFNDQMKGAMQIMVVAIGAVVVIALGATMWNASRADGIVVEAFSVPPSFAAAGIGGDIVADDLTDKIAAIRDIADGSSLGQSKNVRADRDNDIKVEIPDTGVSLAQAWHYLRAWLGNERPLRGGVRILRDGRIALTVALQGQSAVVLEGASGDLDKLEQQAAEHVFASMETLNYPVYLLAQHRNAEALAATQHAVLFASDAANRADAYSFWGDVTRTVTGDARLAQTRARLGITADPQSPLPHLEIMRSAIALSHDEEAFRESRALINARESDIPKYEQGAGWREIVGEARREQALATADYAQAARAECLYCSPGARLALDAEFAARLHDVARSQALIAQAVATDSAAPWQISRNRLLDDYDRSDWPAAKKDAEAYVAGLAAEGAVGSGYAALKMHTYPQAFEAGALAHVGEIAAARALIAGTSRDCYSCLRERGLIESAAKNWRVAEGWFAEAVRQAPSLPAAYRDWAGMLLDKGDLAGAAAKFTAAHERGPHYADPLEGMGEVLMRQNRSDLALAKFKEAARCAPNWGRLHLKWGEALFWSGRKDQARSQFVRARDLFLTAAERRELAKAAHG